MTELFDPTEWREIFVRAFSQLGADLAGFLPNLVGAILILLLGWALSRGIEAIAARGLRTVGLDGVSSRLGISGALSRAQIDLSFSQIVAKLIFWLLMLTFVLSSVETLGLSAVTDAIDRVIAFIPSVIGAAMIGIGGLLLARFVATVVSSAAAAAGFDGAARLGFLSQVLVAGLVAIVALEQLGIETSVLMVPLSIAVGTTGLGVAIAFSLGSRKVIEHIMAGHFLKQSLPRNLSIEVDGHRGLVERVGVVETLISGEGRTWTIPNSRLLELTVVR